MTGTTTRRRVAVRCPRWCWGAAWCWYWPVWPSSWRWSSGTGGTGRRPGQNGRPRRHPPQTRRYAQPPRRSTRGTRTPTTADPGPFVSPVTRPDTSTVPFRIYRAALPGRDNEHPVAQARPPTEGRGMERPDWAPETIDIDRPSAARIYDYALGGLHNFAVDREAARETFAHMPDLPLLMQANRAFLRRAVQFLAGVGVRQFLDIGSGIPTVGNVHEISRQLAPDTRVMYVDIDPVAVAHSRAILAGDPLSGVLQEDLRRPDRILTHPVVRGLIDFSQP